MSLDKRKNTLDKGPSSLLNDLLDVVIVSPVNKHALIYDGTNWLNRAILRADISDFLHTHVKADITDFAHTHPKSDITDFAHKDTHKAGGSDAFTVTDLLDAIARVTARKNSGANTGSRRRINFIEGTNITITLADDSVNEELDLTIAAAGGGGANHNLLDGSTHPDTLAGTVARGDIVVGNLTPKWARRALGLAGQYLRSDGADLLYSSVLAADLPASVILDTESDVVTNAMIIAHTSTKLTITAKGQLNAAIVYNDQNNNLGAFYEDLAQIAAPASPAAGNRRIFVDSADGKIKVKRSDGTTQSLEESGGGAASLIGQMVGQTYLSIAKTNIGAAYVDIYTAAFDQENLMKIDFTNVTDVLIIAIWDYVGVGSQQMRWVNAADNANVLHESPTFTADRDPYDSGWFAKPAWATGIKTIEWQGKSSTSTDDPIAKGYKICVR